MNDTVMVKTKIRKGPVLIRHAYVYSHFPKNSHVAAIAIDLKSRWVETSHGADGDVPFVVLETTNNSTRLSQISYTSPFTTVSFPEYKGWEVWCVSASKDVVYVCLVRSKKF